MMKITQHNSSEIMAIVISCLAVLSTGCATTQKSWPAYQGTIVDGITRQPLQGAVVMLSWHGSYSDWGHGGFACYHLESALTDKNGYYVIPAWEDKRKRKTEIEKPYVMAHLYHPGYQYSTLVGRDELSTDMEVGLYPFKGTLDELFDKGSSIVRWTQCGGAGKNEKKMYPLLKTIYDELRDKVQTPGNQSDLNYIGMWAAKALQSTDNFMSGGGWLSTDQIYKMLEENPL